MWYTMRHWLPASIGFAAGGLGILLVVISFAVVTESEQIRGAIRDLASAVQRNDTAGVLSLVSPSVPDIRAAAEREMGLIQISQCFLTDIKDLNFTSDSTASVQATVYCAGSHQTLGEGAAYVTLYLDFTRDPDRHWRLSNFAYRVGDGSEYRYGVEPLHE